MKKAILKNLNLLKRVASPYNKKIYILHDFNLNLKLYNLNKFNKDKIKKKINKEIIFIDTYETKKVKSHLNKINIFWGNRLDQKLLTKLKNLEWIHFGSSGINFNLKKEILKRKIKFTRSNKIISEPVVASIIQKIFFLGRGMMPILKKRYYDRLDFENNFENISNIFGEKALIFGKGEISKLLKKKLLKLNIKAQIVNKKEKKSIIKDRYLVNTLKHSKFIINCLPLNESTINFFDKSLFKHFSKSYFINIGRGETVNEIDLIKFLDKNNIIAAALDVFNRKDYVSPYKPLNFNSKLWKNNKIFITPHISALCNDYWEKETNLFISLLKKIRKD